MNIRKVTLNKKSQAEPCPKCSNETVFVIKSQQVAEDSCDIWAECECGYDPTFEKVGSRVEDVWGGVDNENASMAIQNWNELLINK